MAGSATAGGGGAIVNLASGCSSFIAQPAFVPYSTTKGAKPPPIRFRVVHCICSYAIPGFLERRHQFTSGPGMASARSCRLLAHDACKYRLPLLQLGDRKRLSAETSNLSRNLAAGSGAIMQMTRCAALDSAKWGVRVNAVCPGASPGAPSC